MSVPAAAFAQTAAEPPEQILDVATDPDSRTLLDDVSPPNTTPSDEHEWLHQMVGEWEGTSELVTGPGAEPVKIKARVKTRMLGAFWLVSEIESEFPGQPMKGLQTVGYDPVAGQYIGTWVDSTGPTVWKYTGRVDESGKTLALDAKGPNVVTGEGESNYRDSYTIVSPDEVKQVSEMQMPDGTWQTFMTYTMNRVK